MRSTAAAVIALLSTLLAGAPAADATARVAVERLAGADRYDTAAVIARHPWGGAVDAVLTRGDDFADALAGANIAFGRPLLTERDRLSDATRAMLEEGDVGQVEIVGGTGAVSDAVADELRAMGIGVSRSAGANRYATAVETYRERYVEGDDFPHRIEGLQSMLLASGEDFPDALAAAPIANGGGFPLLLTRHDALPKETRAVLTDVEQVVIVGGTAAVSAAVEDDLRASGVVVRRIAGADRSSTAVALAEELLDDLDAWGTNHVNIASGASFPDALAGGRFGGLERTFTLLTESATELGVATEAYLRDHRFEIGSLHVLGGTAAVSDGALDAARLAATAGHDPLPILSVDGDVSSTSLLVRVRHGDCGDAEPEADVVTQTDAVVRIRGRQPPSDGVCNDVALETTFRLTLAAPLGARHIEVERFVDPRTCTIDGAPSDRCVAVDPA